MSRVLVTGIKQGLGLQITKTLLETGHEVLGVCRSLNDSLLDLQNNYQTKLKIIVADLDDIEDSVKKIFFAEDKDEELVLSGFVNNAAIAYDDIVSNIHSGPLIKMFNINVFSPMLLTKYVVRNMLLNGIQGSIVHISSVCAHTGYKGLAMYSATKGAIEAFSRTTAREWGSKGIRSNCIVAGFMETGMSASLSSSQKDRIFNRTSLKKPTDLISVAHMVEFLISDYSKSVTGSNVFVDSGTI